MSKKLGEKSLAFHISINKNDKSFKIFHVNAQTTSPSVHGEK